ncbi:hypothetical protein P692DRAFT_20868714 [Suillus brevipes Sb2]|nr:hypothetical protein P692DRAFT_20868714 [Suillus brevipes Sb2]
MSLVNLGNHEAPDVGYEHLSYVYDPQLSSLALLSGVPTITIDFIGYLSLGTQPTLHPLYGLPGSHDALREYLALFAYVVMPVAHYSALETSPNVDVPVFVLANCVNTSPALNLPWVRTKTGLDMAVHGVYNHDGVARESKPLTIIHHAVYPMGHLCLVPEADHMIQLMLPEIDTASQSYARSGQSHSVQDSTIPTSWMGSTVNTMSAGPSSIPGAQAADTQAPSKKKVAAGVMNIHTIMKKCPKWRKALAYLRVMIRMVVCLGQAENPHLLVTSDYTERRGQLLISIWPQCLVRANVAAEELETVLTKTTKVPMAHSDIILLASPWLSQFLYDTRRVVQHSVDDNRAGFGLGADGMWGLALRDKPMGLLKMFIRPFAHVLPLAINGFVHFFREQIAKEIMYHVVFRTTTTCRIRLVLADLDSATFRSAPYPPIDTLALLGSTCYQVLLSKLLGSWRIGDIMPNCPTASQVHEELRETAFILLHQLHNPGYVPFVNRLWQFCTITPPRNHFLENDQNEVALVSWLQKQGCNNFPDSLYVTASVLFGYVDSHDLMAFLDLSLKEVTTQKQLQQETDPIFFPGGGLCLMEDKMHHAQMEVSLFSNAIANACDELESRFHSADHTFDPKKPSTVNTFRNAGACSAPSLVRLGCFQPSKEIEKNATNGFLHHRISKALQRSTLIPAGSLPIPHGLWNANTFQLYTSFPASFLKAWVDRVTYCTYMSTCLAESKPPLPNAINNFIAKESKNMDLLRSDIHILDLKKHRAQTEVDMLSEALSRIAESEGTESDGSSASVSTTYGCDDNWSDDWFSSSSASSDGSVLMDPPPCNRTLVCSHSPSLVEVHGIRSL